MVQKPLTSLHHKCQKKYIITTLLKCIVENSQKVLTIPSIFNSEDYQHTSVCPLLESSLTKSANDSQHIQWQKLPTQIFVRST